MELASQAYQRWLHETRGGVNKSCWWRTGNDTRCNHSQEWVGPLDNVKGEEDQQERKTETGLDITFRLPIYNVRYYCKSHCKQ